jgi:hypothetical protein
MIGPPLSNWFCDIPSAVDTLAAAARVTSFYPFSRGRKLLSQFQQESLVRFYEGKCNKYRAIIDRLKVVVSVNKDLEKLTVIVHLSSQELTYLPGRTDLFANVLMVSQNHQTLTESVPELLRTGMISPHLVLYDRMLID